VERLMKTVTIALIASLLFPVLAMGGEKEEAYLKEKMIPLAQEFIKRVGLPNNFLLGTNQILKYKVDYFDDRPGCLAVMRLTNDYIFSFHTEKNQTEIWTFREIIKTYYELDDAPKEKIEAVKALNLKNKLNDKTALELAKKYFKLLGHKEENFHPPIIHQSYWVGENDVWGNLPYYEVEWDRKDVDLADKEKGGSTLPVVNIYISGIDSSLLYYSKRYLPIGSDF
jgi:hypothetical protein